MVRAITFTELRALCPDGWNRLSTEAYQKIFSHWELDKEVHERDYFKLLCILTGTPFREVNPTPQKEVAVYELTRWVNEEPCNYPTEVPDSIVIDSRTVEIPKDIGELSIGQMITGRQLLEKAKYQDECLSMAAAIMLQPLFDGAKFDYARAKELDKFIRKMPAREIYPIGFFLLNRVLSYGRRRPNFLSRILTNLSARLARMWRLWLRGADSRRSRTFTS